jgi:hypothetical protein
MRIADRMGKELLVLGIVRGEVVLMIDQVAERDLP